MRFVLGRTTKDLRIDRHSEELFESDREMRTFQLSVCKRFLFREGGFGDFRIKSSVPTDSP